MATKLIEIILYKNIKYDFEGVCEAGCIPDSYLAISKPAQVEFELLPDDDVVNAEIESIRDVIKETKRKCAESVQAAEDKIQSLLALPNLTEE